MGEALSKLKKEKSRLARLILLRKQNVYIEGDKKSKFDPKKLSEEIDKKIEDIRKLKIRIQKTNLSTIIDGEKINLAEAIIKIGDLRSQIAHLENLFEKEKESWYLSRDKKEKERTAQLDELEVENEMEQLEIEKVKLDNKIQITNWKIELYD